MEQNDNYEFSQEQNVVVGGLAKKMKFVGIFGILIGVVYLLTGLINKTNLGVGIVNIIIGIWTINAARSFQLVVDTQGNDIKNLMDALGELKKLFNLQYWIYIIAIVIITLAVIVVLALGGSGETLKMLQEGMQ